MRPPPSIHQSTNPLTPSSGARRLLLLGLGNDLLTDDAIGLQVVREIRRLSEVDPRSTLHAPRSTLAIEETPEMGLSLLDFITGYDDLVVVDAIQTSQSPPGTVHELALDSLQLLPAASPHFVGLGEVLALGRQLALPMPSQVKILAIEVADPLTLGAQLTPPLQQAFPAIVHRVLAAIRAFQAEPPSGRLD